MTFWDCRFEDIQPTNWKAVLYRDFSAGLITAMTAIPMAMGFAMAMGLRPEQGIIAGAVACFVGRTFGGSKYQVYGPTAAFIPIILALITTYETRYVDTYYAALGTAVPETIPAEVADAAVHYAHGFLVFVSMIAGVILMIAGLFGWGRIVQKVPASIVVGFTIGIAITIAMTNLGEVLGYKAKLSGGLLDKVVGIVSHFDQFNGWALVLGLATFLLSRYLLRISIYIPAPLIAIAACTAVAYFFLNERGLVLVYTKYGPIPSNFFAITPPIVPELEWIVVKDIIYFAAAIVFVSGVESLLCSSMADRMANNKKTPFDADKEFWGQGLVQIITPLLNGFPCTGALARTATSIKAGAVTPFAGYFKGVLKLGMAFFMAAYLDLVPMACIGGILLWVASNMVKVEEIKHICARGWFQIAVMIFTAVMVPVTDFLTGVLAALVLYGLLYRFFDRPPSVRDSAPDRTAAQPGSGVWNGNGSHPGAAVKVAGKQ
jgi:MFS superfamily sulfate permease-like transporter